MHYGKSLLLYAGMRPGRFANSGKRMCFRPRRWKVCGKPKDDLNDEIPFLINDLSDVGKWPWSIVPSRAFGDKRLKDADRRVLGALCARL
jgi:hypothetical protein